MRAFTKVPFQFPAPGCTTRPGGLFTAIMCLSCERKKMQPARESFIK